MGSFDWLDELTQPKRDVWLPDSGVIEDAAPASGPDPEAPDLEQDVPAGREPLPVPSEPMASNDPEFRPAKQQTPLPSGDAPQGTPDEGGGYDWRRMLASLFGGGEGVSQYDRQKLAEASQRLQEKQAGEQNARLNSAEQRAQEKWGMERDIMNPAKAGKLDAEAGVQRNKKALGDGRSEESKAARLLAAERIEGRVANMAEGMAKQHYSKMAQSLRADEGRISALQAQAWAHEAGADIGDFMRGERADKAQDSKDAQNTEKNKQAWAKINAIKSRSERGPARQSERVLAQQAKNQEKLDKEIEDSDWAQNILLQVKDLKDDVDTGPIAGPVQNFAQKNLGLSTAAFDKLKAKLSMISNERIHDMAGASVSKQEWMRLADELATVDNNDENFLTKLATMIELTEAIKQKAINRYARSNGAPSQPTNTAKRVTAQSPVVLPGETAPPDATPGKAALDAKADKARRAIAGGTAAQQAGARAWLKANGYAE